MNRPLPAFPRHALVPLLLLALLCLLAPPANAARLRPAQPQVELEIVDRDTGLSLPQYRHGGQGWIPGEPGHRYAVRLRNRTGARVLAVLSVDGINAIDGSTARPDQAGYVLGPWQTLEVSGWRKSLGTVAQFVFVDPSASYAVRTGRPDNLGVIGVAVFRERARYPHAGGAIAPPSPSVERARGTTAKSTSANAGPANDAARSESGAAGASGEYEAPARLGTGHGAIEGSQAYYTAFERQGAPSQVTELRYDTRTALRARGLRIDTHDYNDMPYAGSGRPRAFPGFVPDP